MECDKKKYKKLKRDGEFQPDEWVVISAGQLIFHGTNHEEALRAVSKLRARCLVTQVGHEDDVIEISEEAQLCQ